MNFKLIARFLMWNMGFLYFCIFIEIESRIYTFGMLISFIFTSSCLITSLLYFYCFIFKNQAECLLCSTFKWIKDIKNEIITTNTDNQMNYNYFTRYNWTRKILFAVLMSLFYKYNFSPYLYAFVSIPMQIIYFCLSLVVSTFLSPAKGLVFVINESMMTIVVSMTTIIYMNTRVNDIGYLINFTDVMLICIRLQILGTIIFEITSILLAQILRVIMAIKDIRSKV